MTTTARGSGKTVGQPHVHDWDRPPGGGRPNADNRGGARLPNSGEVRPRAKL